ncbi:MAG: accessory factor UbiK family protein [Candidatus Methylophosphatis roskildensis]
MLNPKFFEDLSGKIAQVLAASPAADFEKNAKAMMTNAFSRLDLVTREEFDVQREVLSRSRQKLGELEARIASLEAKLAQRGPAEGS